MRAGQLNCQYAGDPQGRRIRQHLQIYVKPDLRLRRLRAPNAIHLSSLTDPD